MSIIKPQTSTLAFALSQPANNNLPLVDETHTPKSVNAETAQNSDLVKPKWAARAIRLDPFKLPQNVSHGAVKHQEMDGSKFSLTLDHDGATLYRVNEQGRTVEYMLPTKAFMGITARTFENEDGTTTVTLELMHENKALSIPLLSSSEMNDVAADWHAWSRALKLPMFIQESDGQIVKIKNNTIASSANAPQSRRRRSFAINHRPKFAINRKMGNHKMGTASTTTISSITRLSAADIIARDAVK